MHIHECTVLFFIDYHLFWVKVQEFVGQGVRQFFPYSEYVTSFVAQQIQ